jgi:hypothetical protein
VALLSLNLTVLILFLARPYFPKSFVFDTSTPVVILTANRNITRDMSILVYTSLKKAYRTEFAAIVLYNVLAESTKQEYAIECEKMKPISTYLARQTTPKDGEIYESENVRAD